VSLDAITTEVYQRLRGDYDTTPADVCGRIQRYAERVPVHVNVCVTPETIDEMELIVEALAWLQHHPRKVTFLAVIGDRYDRCLDFWKEYRYHMDRIRMHANRTGLPFTTNFDESVRQTRDWCASDECTDVRCWAGVATFHAKANGDVYPCCLTGGEAIATHPEMRMGNAWEKPITEILCDYKPAHDYRNPVRPCREICQWKQAAFNQACEAASLVQLSMP
jgi:MoaA/NifB/PqqE/SkfB family radical SAM enzyme